MKLHKMPTKSHQNFCWLPRQREINNALLCWSSGLLLQLQHMSPSHFRQSSERLPCRVKSELNCFEHYNRSVLKDKCSISRRRKRCDSKHSSKLKHGRLDANLETWTSGCKMRFLFGLLHRATKDHNCDLYIYDARRDRPPKLHGCAEHLKIQFKASFNFS